MTRNRWARQSGGGNEMAVLNVSIFLGDRSLDEESHHVFGVVFWILGPIKEKKKDGDEFWDFV